MTSKALGVDVSHWQGDIRWDTLANAGVKFVFIKASEGTGRVDKKFVANWKGAKKAGLLRGAYHFYRPDFHTLEQAQGFYKTLAETKDLGELPPVLDIERRPFRATEIRQCLQELERLFGKRPIIYTAPFLWNEMGGVSWAKDYPLWVAQYPYTRWVDNLLELILQRKPILPRDWTSWLFWQFTERGPGRAYGMQSSGLDMNYFAGDVAALQAFAGAEVAAPAVEEPPEAGVAPAIPELPTARVMSRVVNVRSTPEVTNGNIRSVLRAGDEPEVLAIHQEGNDIWLKIGWEQWAAMRYNSNQYLQWIETET